MFQNKKSWNSNTDFKYALYTCIMSNTLSTEIAGFIINKKTGFSKSECRRNVLSLKRALSIFVQDFHVYMRDI